MTDQTAERPFIHIEQRPDPDDQGAFQLGVKAGNGIDSTDEIVALLLAVVENITGVSADLYATEIDIARRAARLAQGVRERLADTNPQEG